MFGDIWNGELLRFCIVCVEVFKLNCYPCWGGLSIPCHCEAVYFTCTKMLLALFSVIYFREFLVFNFRLESINGHAEGQWLANCNCRIPVYSSREHDFICWADSCDIIMDQYPDLYCTSRFIHLCNVFQGTYLNIFFHLQRFSRIISRWLVYTPE